ncbi:hypothetical protein PFISCL1PPCAC_12244, partial [Pristionchus fissidentatus]
MCEANAFLTITSGATKIDEQIYKRTFNSLSNTSDFSRIRIRENSHSCIGCEVVVVISTDDDGKRLLPISLSTSRLSSS